jgi:hypothetical protein
MFLLADVVGPAMGQGQVEKWAVEEIVAGDGMQAVEEVGRREVVDGVVVVEEVVEEVVVVEVEEQVAEELGGLDWVAILSCARPTRRRECTMFGEWIPCVYNAQDPSFLLLRP